MRKLGKAQIGMLKAMNLYREKGVTKSHFHSGNDWRVIDRLNALGLCEQRFIDMQGPTYFINAAGLAAIGNSSLGDKTDGP